MNAIEGVDLRVVAEAEKRAHIKEQEAAVRRYVGGVYRELSDARMAVESARAVLADKEARVADLEARSQKVLAGDWSGVQVGAFSSAKMAEKDAR